MKSAPTPSSRRFPEHPKRLSPKYFYDATGSELFEAITRLPEYYPTRTEATILEAAADDIASRTLPGGVLVEFGSGSSRKTEILLNALPSLCAYVPIDVAPTAVAETGRQPVASWRSTIWTTSCRQVVVIWS